MAVASCSPDESRHEDADGQAADASAVCPEAALKPSGACCPTGAFYDFPTAACVAIGPAGCAATALSAPDKCTPRWCRDGVGGLARACTDEEIAAGQGCKAGELPDAVNGACVPAGDFPGAADGDGPWPPLVPLPAVDDTFFCRESPDAPVGFCRGADLALCRRSPDGKLPESERCVYVGVPYALPCPPGFLVDPMVVPVPGGLPACKPDPALCGSDPWGDPTLVDGDGVLFVAATGSPARHGTRASPLKSIGAAIAVAKPGATVAVAAGTYVESLVITKPVRLRGRCAALVRLVGQVGQVPLHVKAATKGEAEVRGLRIDGPGQGVGVEGPMTTRLVEVAIHGMSGVGLATRHPSGSLHVERAVISATDAGGSGMGGTGLQASEGATLTATDVRVTGSHTAGATAHEGSNVTLTRVLIDGTRPQPATGFHGIGIAIYQGSVGVVQASRIHGNTTVGIFTFGQGSELSALATLVDGTRILPTSEPKDDAGIKASSGGRVLLTGVRVTGNSGEGVIAAHKGSEVVARGLLVDSQKADLDGHRGRGIGAYHGARVVATDVRASANRVAGAVALGGGAELKLQRALIDNTRPRLADELFGWGLSADFGGRVDATAARCTGGRQFGVAARNLGTTLALRRVLIDAVGHAKQGVATGAGLSVYDHAAAEVRDVQIREVSASGLACSDAGTKVVASGVRVVSTQPELPGDEYGRGVVAQLGADLRLTGAVLVGNRDAGLVAVKAAGVRVAGVRISATGTDATGRYGTGFTCDAMVGPCELHASYLHGNHTAALTVRNAKLLVRATVLAATGAGKYPEGTASKEHLARFLPIADGLVAVRARLDADRVLVAANPRAGIVLREPVATLLDRSATVGGYFGLVHDGETPDVRRSLLSGETVDVASGAVLYLPPLPSAVDVGD